MKKRLKITLLICLFLFSVGNISKIKAQNIKVGYTYTFQNLTYPAILFIEDEASLFEIDEIDPNKSMTNEYDEEGELNVVVKGGKYLNTKVVKNVQNNTMLYFVPNLKNKKVYTNVKEELPNFDWKLVNKQEKDILDYRCKKATCSFRGRKYEVWYATDLKFSNGPWKFGGLPGLILEIRSLDNVFSIVASSIQKHEPENKIDTSIPASAISWADYKILVEKQITNQKKFIETDMASRKVSVSFTLTHTEPDLEVEVEVE